MLTWKQGRVAAWIAAAILVLVGVVQLAALLHAAFAADLPGPRALILAAVAGLLAIVSAAVLLVRVGYWRDRVPFELGRQGAPWVAYASLGGAVLGFAGQLGAWYVAGPVNLVISLLAFAVTRSELPAPPPAR